MDDERAVEALVHLQRAMRELITAARLGLDVLEEVLDQVGAVAAARSAPTETAEAEPEPERPRVERIRLS